MIKRFKVANSTKKKVEVITRLLFKDGLSAAELDVLSGVVDFATNNELMVSVDVAKQIKSMTGVGDSAFSTALFRLEKKGIIAKSGKTITLHPAFINVAIIEKIVLSFS